MTRTVRPIGRAWGIIGDMIRVLGGLAAWLGGTAAAVCMAWFGAGMVVRNTTASPVAPVIRAAPTAGSGAPAVPAAPAPASPPAPSSPAPSSPARPAPAPSLSSPAARRPAPAPAPSGQARSYALDGGQVTLLVTSDSAQLVTAVPEAGFTVQNWSGPGWLRVDFSSGTQVSSLIASWNGHAPSVTVTN
jgi:hypothetical protein